MNRGTAVVFLPGDARLEMLCSVILRHMGYRVYEANDPAEALAMVEAEATRLLVSTPETIDDPRITAFCIRNNVAPVSVGPDKSIERLLPLLECHAAPS